MAIIFKEKINKRRMEEIEVLARRALRILANERVEHVEFFYDEAITDLMLTVSQFCDIVSHFEADTSVEQAKIEKKGEFVTIGEVEEAKVPEIVEPDEPSTDMRPYRKGKVRQMVAP